ncbi:MAG: hypothetical protein AMJ81_08060 [Phycisphaerae bacterium SM23_33]|nr:MAG: hypothetical protein AMJ81_08060 [Phycisphaerae bacterium SM23_33]
MAFVQIAGLRHYLRACATSESRQPYRLLASTMSTGSAAAGDVLEIEFDAVSGAGTMGKGVFAYVDLEEHCD